ncbi:hypothetical protein GOV08_03495 [Candidatus Woesearchaeota archaeon]|nr:hypothetical protein [Candidatus Woesearchaeota archaeon]
MGCYAVPAVAAIIHFFFRKNSPRLRNDKRQEWLNQLLLGGAIFGVVDHAWNGELLMVGKKPLVDLALGIIITAVIFLAWGIMVVYDKHVLKQAMKASC